MKTAQFEQSKFAPESDDKHIEEPLNFKKSNQVQSEAARDKNKFYLRKRSYGQQKTHSKEFVLSVYQAPSQSHENSRNAPKKKNIGGSLLDSFGNQSNSMEENNVLKRFLLHAQQDCKSISQSDWAGLREVLEKESSSHESDSAERLRKTLEANIKKINSNSKSDKDFRIRLRTLLEFKK